MASEITVMPRGTLPTFPSSGGVDSRPDNAKMIVGVFVQMSKYLGDIKMNTDKIIQQMPTKDMFENLAPAPKDSLKEKEKEKEQTIGERITKKFDSITEKAVGFFEKMWTILGPMLLGFIMGITDLTKPMGLLKVALGGLLAFLSVKVLGAILIRGLLGVIGKTVSFLTTKIVNGILRVMGRAPAAGGISTGIPIPDGTTVGKGSGTKAPQGKKRRGMSVAQKVKYDTLRAEGVTAKEAYRRTSGFGGLLSAEDRIGKGAVAATETAATPTAKAVSKGVGKGSIKGFGKTAAKVGLKKIPGIALLAGLAFGAQRAYAGDWGGAAAEVASGATGATGLGIAGSIAIDAGLIKRDMDMQAEVDKVQAILASASATDKKASKTLAELEAAQANGDSAFEQLQIIKDNGYDVDKLIPKKGGKADNVQPTPKAVASGTQLDQTRQQAQKAKQPMPWTMPTATNNNVVQTNNVDNKTVITKPPRAERESLSYGK